MASAAKHLLWLALLCLGVQWLIASRTVVPAQDAVRLVQMAREMQESGWWATVIERHESPVFPTHVWLLHLMLYGRTAWPPADSWAATVQLASLWPLLLGLIPLYFIMRKCFSPRVAILAGLFYCVMPVLAQLGADGLADSTHLLLFLLAVWASIQYLDRKQHDAPAWQAISWMMLSGICLSLAVLTKLESLVLVPTLLGVMCWQNQAALLNKSWGGWLKLGQELAALLAGLLICWMPYWLATHEWSSRHAGAFFQASPIKNSNTARTSPKLSTNKLTFPAKEKTISKRRFGYVSALGELSQELPQAACYWIGLLALLGAWKGSACRVPGVHLLKGLFIALFLLSIIHFSAKAGYMAERHLLLPVVLGLGWAGQGVEICGTEIARRLSRWSLQPNFGMGVVALIAVLACLPIISRTSHRTRAGHYAAGKWLAQRVQPQEVR